MNLAEAIILAIIQGIAEWFPVSSTGHLVIGEKLLNLESNILYNIFLHLGSLLVVLYVFRTDILELLKVLIGKGSKEYQYLWIYLVIGTVPIMLMGFFFKDAIEKMFGSLLAVAVFLFITGLFLYLSKRKTAKRLLNAKSSLLIGLAQAVAALPGISRSGMTISTAMMLGIDRQKAARYSFLLFIPAILGALFLQIKDVQINNELLIMLLGTLITMIVSYFALTYLLKLIKHRKFHYFAYYCWVLGFIILLFSVQNGF